VPARGFISHELQELNWLLGAPRWDAPTRNIALLRKPGGRGAFLKLLSRHLPNENIVKVLFATLKLNNIIQRKITKGISWR